MCGYIMANTDTDKICFDVDHASLYPFSHQARMHPVIFGSNMYKRAAADIIIWESLTVQIYSVTAKQTVIDPINRVVLWTKHDNNSVIHSEDEVRLIMDNILHNVSLEWKHNFVWKYKHLMVISSLCLIKYLLMINLTMHLF